MYMLCNDEACIDMFQRRFSSPSSYCSVVLNGQRQFSTPCVVDTRKTCGHGAGQEMYSKNSAANQSAKHRHRRGQRSLKSLHPTSHLVSQSRHQCLHPVKHASLTDKTQYFTFLPVFPLHLHLPEKTAAPETL